MNQNWRSKLIITLVSVVLAALFLVPTLAHFNQVKEKAEKEGKPLPWYVAWYPMDKSLNLGLDLKGGIYVELEVDVKDALKNRVDSIASEMNRYLKDKNQASGAHLQRLSNDLHLKAFAANPEELKMIQARVKEFYDKTLIEDSSLQELTFQSASAEEQNLQNEFSQAQNQLKSQNGFIYLERSGSIFHLQHHSTTSSEEFKKLLLPQLSQWKEVQEAHKLFYKIDDSYLAQVKEETVKQAVNTIRNRIDRYGVAEPSIRKLGDDRIAVELPGVSDPDRAIAMVKKSGRLEFKMLDTTKTQSEIQALIAQIRKEQNIPEVYNEEIIEKINQAALGKIPAESEIAFELHYDAQGKKVTGASPYLIKKKTEVSGSMLQDANVSIYEGKPRAVLSFNPEGTRAFAELTQKYQPKVHGRAENFLAIMLDGNVNSAPGINEPILNGGAEISFGAGSYETALKEAQDLVFILREGALPATLKEVTKTVIGPSLGKAAIDKSLKAALVAALSVIIFMMIYYKTSGVLANLVLAINILLLMGILALFQATITLPGIAGIVLTMGMALDGSIIIYERIKEELKSGKNVRLAVEAGFENAFTALIDTHITTFLSGAVLYQFGTGPIRGFAVTLMVGVVTTIFTAYWVSKMLFEYWTVHLKAQKISI